MSTTFYVAEMTGVFDRPITASVAEILARELGLSVDEIGCRHMTADDGSTGWGAFRLHHVLKNKARAETAARWLRREVPPTSEVFIFTDWHGPLADAAPKPAGGDV